MIINSGFREGFQEAEPIKLITERQRVFGRTAQGKAFLVNDQHMCML